VTRANASGEIPAEPVVYTVEEVARLLRISRNTAYNLVSQGVIPSLRLSKSIRVPQWSLLQYLSSASGSPVPIDFEVAISPLKSVDSPRPISGEGNPRG
jgi:excisionase family DNA binding protein